MTRTRVTLNHRGMAALLRSRGVEDDMEDRAERVVDFARRVAPVVTGTYKDSLEASTEQHPTRVVGRATANVPYATQVEAAHRVLGRAIDAAR